MQRQGRHARKPLLRRVCGGAAAAPAGGTLAASGDGPLALVGVLVAAQCLGAVEFAVAVVAREDATFGSVILNLARWAFIGMGRILGRQGQIQQDRLVLVSGRFESEERLLRGIYIWVGYKGPHVGTKVDIDGDPWMTIPLLISKILRPQRTG
ncbi:2-oxoacid dehydrogenases acyltransferase family protein [Striga asiatica]|uniref:2-oxoacid dehydrogenases acyltransferase family protein n=1 Tax=Striga asiatica TaxID=4170 RepID=A0A5A7QVN8_STRAF|nr:2-oxoacid dehydrogenases acyltransferase family protein [Striga asiatica]